MHLSSDSPVYFKRIVQGRTVIGWRFQYDFGDYTHVSIIQIGTEPAFKTYRQTKLIKIYCNIVSKSVTDPHGTLGYSGSFGLIRAPGMTHRLDSSRIIQILTVYIVPVQLDRSKTDEITLELSDNLAGKLEKIEIDIIFSNESEEKIFS